MLETLNLFTLVGSSIGKHGTAGIIVQNLATGERVSQNEGLIFPAASIIKLPILWALLRRAARGEIDLHAPYTVQTSDLVGGAGLLWQFRSRPTLPLIDLATMMIVLSDNTATNILIDRLTLKGINTAIMEMGLVDTELQRKMMDWSDPTRQNWTSPRDVIRMLDLLLLEKEPLGRFGELPQTIMEGQQCRNKFHIGLPYETVVANKTGELQGVEHDAALIRLPQADFLAVVLTKDLATNNAGIDLCRNLARTLIPDQM